MRILISLFLFTATLSAGNWPGWRGPSGDGISPEKNIPTKWSATENVAWKVAIPGEGHSSPVIWGDRIFLTASLTEKNERHLLCLDRRTGKTIWASRGAVSAGVDSPPEQRASGTPATDGKQVYVTFMRAEGDKVVAPNVGSERLITPGKIVVAAYDLDGIKNGKRRRRLRERAWLQHLPGFV